MLGLLVSFLLSLQKDILTTDAYMNWLYQGDLKQKVKFRLPTNQNFRITE